jgi:hypothetical protein
MTPDERNALLFDVQRALDGAGIGRESLSHGIDPAISLDEGTHLHIFVDSVNVYVSDPFENNFGTVATFTFDELFPPLVWEDYPKCEWSVAFIGYWEAFKIFSDAPSTLRIQNDGQRVELDFHTPDLAKEAAQSLADILAKADRARRAGVQ